MADTHRETLRAGTVVHVNGIPCELVADTEVETATVLTAAEAEGSEG